jgi:hypothetical protein
MVRPDLVGWWMWRDEGTGRGKGKRGERLTWLDSSSRTWSYSLSATQKMIEVTFSKQWIHFFRSLRWPPTSNMLVLWLDSVSCRDGGCRGYELYAQLAHSEPCLVYAGSLCPGSQDIGLGWNVIWSGYSLYLIEKAGGRQLFVGSCILRDSLWR